MNIQDLTQVINVEAMHTKIVIAPVPAGALEIAYMDGLLNDIEAQGYRFHLLRDLNIGNTSEGEVSIVATALTFIKSDEPAGEPLHLRLSEDGIPDGGATDALVAWKQLSDSESTIVLYRS